MLVLVPIIVLFTVFVLRDARRSGPDPVDECTDYLALVDRCMGEDTAKRLSQVYAKPPKETQARTALARECTASRDRLRKACL